MRFVKMLVLVIFFLSLLVQPSLAKAADKIAYIDAAKVFENYNKTKEADEKLNKEGQKKNEERDELVKEVNKLRDEIELMSKSAKTKKEAQLNEKMREVQDFDRETRLNLQRKRDDLMKEILEEIEEVIKDYGKKKGYEMILDSRVLLYANEGKDVSDDIIKQLNKRR